MRVVVPGKNEQGNVREGAKDVHAGADNGVVHLVVFEEVAGNDERFRLPLASRFQGAP